MKIDMSPKAITQRLKKTSELRRLCLALGGERLKKKLMSKEYNINFVKEDSANYHKTNLSDQEKSGGYST